MKIFRPAPPVFRALLALLLFAACSSVPTQAQASGWRFDHFECTGSTQWTPGSTTQTFLWPATQAGSPDIQFGLNQYGAPCQSVGTICAVFTRQGSGQPSDSLTVLISSSAGMYGTPPQPDPDDGFQDPLTPSSTATSKTSSGSHVVKLSNSGGSTTLKTDVYSLSAICGPSDDAAGSGTAIDFQVHIANASLEGHSTADTAGWDASAPRFFSGTACTAKGVAAALSGNVAHAQLCIGENGSDTVVNEYFDGGVPGVPSAASVPLNAMFDSTHFKDGAKIKLTLKVWDTDGGNYDVKVMGPAKNRAYLLANDERDPQQTQATYAVKAFHGMNYTSLGVSQDHKPVVLQRLPHNTAFFTLSHGNEGDFTDSYFSPAPDAQYDSNVSVESQDIATALSPENASNANYNPDLAPYNFVYLDSCEGAGYTSGPVEPRLANAFGIYQGSIDRAWLGWHNEIFNIGYDAQTWNERLWNNFVQGDTVLVSVQKSCLLGEPQGELVHGVEAPDDVRPVVIGDGRTKLHGVYLGASADEWFKPLP